jgi:hypothetical protein
MMNYSVIYGGTEKKRKCKKNGKVVYLFRQYGGAGFSVQDIVSQEI